MNLLLNSRDTRVYEVCRRTLQSMGEPNLALTWGNLDQPAAEADLTIWDLDGISAPLPVLENGARRRNVFIVSREQTAALGQFLPNNTTAIILKPLAEGTLRVWLKHALNRDGHETDAAVNSKNLLQFMLEAIVKLQEYDQDRTNFIARAVHDFRAPLTALRGYCGLLLDQQFGPIPAAETDILLRMRQSVERLSGMAEDMFQLAVGSRPEPSLALEEIDIAACIDQAVHELRPLMEAKCLRLNIEAAAAPRSVRADRSQIEQVLLNILDNAAKFTPRCGSIDIEGYPFFWERRFTKAAITTGMLERRLASIPAENAYRIDIRDSGPSIPPDQLSTIFEEYISFKGGQDRSGAGLGLATILFT